MAIEIIKGNPTLSQVTALNKLVGDLTEQAERRRNAKAHTRGWFGSPNDPRVNSAVNNPAGFRSPVMPRDNS